MPKSSSRSATVYAQCNPQGDPFCYSPTTNPELEVIGLVLWATEGDKTQLSLANGNANIIKKYLEFLRRVCCLREEKIKAVIHCHDSLPYNDCLTFWSDVTRIPPERFNKPFIKIDKGGKRNFPHGIVRIVANNTRLMGIFKDRLKIFDLERG